MPDWKVEIRTWLAGSGPTPTREAAIVDELAQYLDDNYVELLSGGVTPAEAERLTRAELGSSTGGLNPDHAIAFRTRVDAAKVDTVTGNWLDSAETINIGRVDA